MPASNNGYSMSELADLQIAVLPQVREELELEQTYTEHPFLEQLMPWIDGDNVKELSYGENIQLRQPVNSVVKHRPWASDNAVRGKYNARQEVSLVHFKEMSLSVEMLEQETNGDDDTKLFDQGMSLETARAGALDEMREKQLAGVPEEYNENFLGPRYWLGMSCDANGAFVSQPDPAFSITRTRFSTGAATHLFGNKQIDATAGSNSNYRGLGWTYDKVGDEGFIKRVAESFRMQNFSKIAKKKGRMQSPVFFFAVPPSIYQDLADIGNTEGAREGELYAKKTIKIYGENIVRSEILGHDPSMPCVCLNKNGYRLKKNPSMWMKDLPKKPLGDSSWCVPLLYTWQGFASTRRRLGFIVHGSY
jgi:hypothetical protein